MEEGAETTEELGVDHLSRSLPLKVGIVGVSFWSSLTNVTPIKSGKEVLQPKY